MNIVPFFSLDKFAEGISGMAMSCSMNFTGNKLKVLHGIIEFVTINMMNFFIMKKFSVKAATHYNSVFIELLPIYANSSIAMRNGTFTIGSLFANMGRTVSTISHIMHCTQTFCFRWLVAIKALWFRFFESLSAFLGTEFNISVQTIGFDLKPFATNYTFYGFHKLYPTVKKLFRQEGKLNNRMNSGKPETDYAVGNPEPSQKYTSGRCRDYWRGLVPLITSLSVRHESDEIVRHSWKHGKMSYAKDTLFIPPYEKGNYIGLASTKALRGIKNDPDFQTWRQWLRPGDVLFNSEVGMIEQIRFIEVNNTSALSNAKGTSSVLGEALIFGEDGVALAEVATPELRAAIPGNFGRYKAVAWWGVLAYGLIWNATATAGEARVIYVTSA